MASEKPSLKRRRAFLEEAENFQVYLVLAYILGTIAIGGFFWSEMNYGSKLALLKDLRQQTTLLQASEDVQSQSQALMVQGSLKSSGIDDPYIQAADQLYLIRYEEAYPFDKTKALIKTPTVAQDISFADRFKGEGLIREILAYNWLEEITLDSSRLKDSKHAVVEGNKLILAADAAHLAPGDIKVSYKGVRAKDYSVVGVARGAEFRPWESPQGSLGFLVQEGKLSLHEMFEHFSNKYQSYGLIASVYALGLYLIAWCFFLYPLQGQFRSWSFLNPYARVAPFIIGIPTALVIILAAKVAPYLLGAALTMLLFFLFVSYFLYKNRALKVSGLSPRGGDNSVR